MIPISIYINGRPFSYTILLVFYAPHKKAKDSTGILYSINSVNAISLMKNKVLFVIRMHKSGLNPIIVIFSNVSASFPSVCGIRFMADYSEIADVSAPAQLPGTYEICVIKYMTV